MINRLYPHVLLFTWNPFKIYEFKELIKDVKFSKDELILDIGCGSGLQSLLLGKRCKKIVGIDTSEKAISDAQLNSLRMGEGIESEFRCVKIENAGFKAEHFDKVFSICVIEHIPNYTDVLRETYRILKKGGQTIFSVDCLETIEDNNLREKHRRDSFAYKYFRVEELKIILEKIGFNNVVIYPIFKSDFAKKLFIKGINNKFRYSRFQAILAYFRLRYEERHCVNQDKGIFLVVKCSK